MRPAGAPICPPAAANAARERVELRWLDLAAGPDAVARAEAVLTAAELERARRATPAVHRRRVLLRAALRRAVAPHLGVDAAAVPLTTTRAGRPEIRGPWRIDVNCSSSSGLGIVAVGHGRRVGVDLERIPEWTPGVLAESWLAPVERAALAALPVDVRAFAATRAWTRKEAVLKARGTGLLDDPGSLVTPVSGPAGTVAGWEVLDVHVPSGWVASLAVGPLEGVPL